MIVTVFIDQLNGYGYDDSRNSDKAFEYEPVLTIKI